MKKLVFIFISLISTTALSLERVHGKITKVYSEDFGFTYVLDISNGSQQCGGNLFTVYRESITNFEELYSLTLMAFASAKDVEIVLKECVNNRASVDHMAVY